MLQSRGNIIHYQIEEKFKLKYKEDKKNKWYKVEYRAFETDETLHGSVIFLLLSFIDINYIIQSNAKDFLLHFTFFEMVFPEILELTVMRILVYK